MKCKDCIFEINDVCVNPESDWCDMKVFPKYDGCEDGRETPLALSILQHFALIKANKKIGEQE